jgi:hypothetical protein
MSLRVQTAPQWTAKLLDGLSLNSGKPESTRNAFSGKKVPTGRTAVRSVDSDGTGQTALSIVRIIKQYNKNNIAGFIDSHSSGTFQGHVVYKLDEFIGRRDGTETVIIASQCVAEIYDNLCRCQVSNIYNAYPLHKRYSNRLLLPGWT